MPRASYQVLVIPYRLAAGTAEFCVFRRSDRDIWQFIAGGGETGDESILASAKREAYEEAGIGGDRPYTPLDSQCSIPACHFRDAEKLWGIDCLVIPEYSFAVEVGDVGLTLSREHTQYEWADYGTAAARLRYDSNRTALWELKRRIELGLLKAPKA